MNKKQRSEVVVATFAVVMAVICMAVALNADAQETRTAGPAEIAIFNKAADETYQVLTNYPDAVMLEAYDANEGPCNQLAWEMDNGAALWNEENISTLGACAALFYIVKQRNLRVSL